MGWLSSNGSFHQLSQKTDGGQTLLQEFNFIKNLRKKIENLHCNCILKYKSVTSVTEVCVVV